MKPDQIAAKVLYFLIIIQLLACNDGRDSRPLNDAEATVNDSIDSNGTSIHFISKGKGVPIILIHGFLSNSNWNWIESGTFDSLAKNNRVIAMDVRGHGASEKPHSQEAYGKEIVEDINRLMEHLKIDRAILVGYSMGGEITLAYLTAYPEKVIKAIAGGCGWMKTNDQKFELWKQYRDLLATTPKGMLVSERLWQVKDTTAAFFKMVNSNDAIALSGIANGMLQLCIEENKLRNNTVPTLLLVGENDDLRKSAEDAISVAANMRLQVLKGQDHISAISDPFFIKAIEEFVTEK
jgi:pimeloyl-ACP methyl ester carboxylesterase